MKTRLDILISASEEFVVTPEIVAEFNARIQEAEKILEEKDRQRQVTSEWMNQTYTI